MPSFYSKYLGPKLSERILELLSKPHEEQVSLYEELAIARSTAVEALKLAQPLFDEKASKKLNTETKALLVSTLQDAMNNVKDMVLACAKIEQAAEDKISIKVLNLIVNQIVLAVNDVCGTENIAIAEAIAQAIDDRVRLPVTNRMLPDVKVEVG